jgi:hypothetical protein
MNQNSELSCQMLKTNVEKIKKLIQHFRRTWQTKSSFLHFWLLDETKYRNLEIFNPFVQRLVIKDP